MSDYDLDEKDDATQLLEQKQIECVQIDGLVLLKILKHGRDTSDDEVPSGTLLGLSTDGLLEVSNCFPSINEESASHKNNYQTNMLECLRNVNFDINVVGWYQATTLGNFLNKETISAQYEYQKQIPNSIMLIYDLYAMSKGELLLRAFRLTDKFMEIYSTNDLSHTNFAKHGVDAKSILQEVPIKVYNSLLIHMFLFELHESKELKPSNKLLKMTSNEFIMKVYNEIFQCLSSLEHEQIKLLHYQKIVNREKGLQQQFWQKREQENADRREKGEKPLPKPDLKKVGCFRKLDKPNMLGVFLLQFQLDYLVSQVSKSVSGGFQKLFFAKNITATKDSEEKEEA